MFSEFEFILFCFVLATCLPRGKVSGHDKGGQVGLNVFKYTQLKLKVHYVLGPTCSEPDLVDETRDGTRTRRLLQCKLQVRIWTHSQPP